MGNSTARGNSGLSFFSSFGLVRGKKRVAVALIAGPAAFISLSGCPQCAQHFGRTSLGR